jgi:NAD(P)-dependent dehydrogenase (short-subunit alcohol dehydrogenase family)
MALLASVNMPQGRLAGKVAVVTGGASGIGLATVRRFVAEGARVMIGDVDAAGATEAASRLGDGVACRSCDVRHEAEVEDLVESALAEFGGLDIVFANAGIGSYGSIVDTELDEWRRVVEVDLIGPLLTTQHAARRMNAGGSIVLTASLNAVQPAAGMSAYCCSKAGVAMLAQVAALELGPRNIRVNAIGPGLVRTRLTEGMWLMPSIVEEFDENAPLATETSADDVANLVTFLASDESSSISGTLQLVDRGAHTKRYPDLPARLAEVARARNASPP